MKITPIDNNNIEGFRYTLPDVFAQSIDYSNRFYLGVIDDDNDKNTAAGAIVFDLKQLGDYVCAQLKWIYVLSQKRNKGFGNALMEEFTKALNEAQVDELMVDISADSQHDELCSFLEKWGFVFSFMQADEAEIKADELSDNGLLSKNVSMDDVKVWKSIAIPDRKRIFSQFSVADISDEKLMVDDDRIDANVSAVVYNNNKAAGLILFAKEGIHERLLVFEADEPVGVLKLFKFSYQQIISRYNNNYRIVIPMDTAKGLHLVSYILPDYNPDFIRRGIYLTDDEFDDYASFVEEQDNQEVEYV